VRATHSVSGGGAWYYEVEVGDVSDQVARGPGGAGHCRIGFAMDRVIFEDLDAPVGFASPESEYGFSYAYGSKSGHKFHRSVPEKYGEPYKAGDVIGCLLILPPPSKGGGVTSAMKPYHSSAVMIKASRHTCKHWISYYIPLAPKVHEGSRLCFYK